MPCVELTPRSPEIAGMETLAIEVSNTFINVAALSAIVAMTSAEPVNGGCSTGLTGATGPGAEDAPVIVVVDEFMAFG